MANESSYESDISESWFLVDINLNESEITPLEAFISEKKTENSSLKAENDEPSKSADSDFRKIDSNCSRNNLDKSKIIESENLDSCVSDKVFRFSSNEKQDLKDESSDETKNDSCDGESIEILDMDGNNTCDDPDNDRVAFTIIGDEEKNDVNYHDNKNCYFDDSFENSNLTISHRRKRRRRRKLSCASESSSNCNSDILSCNLSNSDLSLNVNKKIEAELKMEESKLNIKPIYKHCRNNFTNTALSLSVGVIFAGVACIAIGHFLGVHEAEKTADELINTLKKLQSENFALQSRLFELDKEFTSKNFNKEVKSELDEINGQPHQAQEVEHHRLNAVNKESDKISVTNSNTALNSFEWFLNIQNLMKNKEFIQNQHFSELKKVVLHIHDQLSFLNSKGKNYMKLKNLEEKYFQISKTSQKILKKLSSSHKNLESSYHKLIELRDGLNKKLSKMFAEVSQKICTVEQGNSPSCDEKISVVGKINCQSVKCEMENENVLDATTNRVLVYKFPQPEQYYLNKENVSVSNSIHENMNSDKSLTIENFNETYNKKNGTKDLHEKNYSTDTLIQKNSEGRNSFSERRNSDLPNLLKSKNKFGKKDKKIERGRKIAKKKEREQIKVFLNNMKEEVKRNIKNKKSNEKVFDTKQKNNFYKNFDNKINSADLRKDPVKTWKKDFRVKSKIVKKKLKSSKFRRAFKSKIIEESSYEPQDNKTEFFLNPNFSSERHPFHYFNETGNWFFKWTTGRQQSRYHQGLGDWQFDRAKARKVLRNEELNINWHLKRAMARQSERHKNELNGENYEKKNYGDKGFYHEEFSWI